MRKIRVIHSVETWLPQTMTWLYGLLSPLNNNDEIENIIVCEDKINNEQFDMPIIKIDNNKGRYYNLKRKLTRRLTKQKYNPALEEAIKDFKPDFIHTHIGYRAYYDMYVAKKYNIPHIVSFYGYDVNSAPKQSYWKNKYKLFLKNIDFILCEGPYMANAISKLGFPKEKIHLQRLGINIEKIKYVPRIIDKNNEIVFMLAGTFREKKGFVYALEALYLLSSEFDNFKIIIVGGADSIPSTKLEKNIIKNIVSHYNLENKTEFLGYISYNKIIETAYKCHVFISPSVMSFEGDTEGGAPVGIIEMAASGMPIISTTHCDIPFILSKENNKILSSERSSYELKNQIINLLNDIPNVENIIESNRKYIEENLDFRTTSNQLLSFYKSIE